MIMTSLYHKDVTCQLNYKIEQFVFLNYSTQFRFWIGWTVLKLWAVGTTSALSS